MPCSAVVEYQHFGCPCCLHLQASSTWRWRQHGPPKCWYPTAALYSVTTQKTIWNIIAVKASKLDPTISFMTHIIVSLLSMKKENGKVHIPTWSVNISQIHFLKFCIFLALNVHLLKVQIYSCKANHTAGIMFQVKAKICILLNLIHKVLQVHSEYIKKYKTKIYSKLLIPKTASIFSPHFWELLFHSPYKTWNNPESGLD